MMLIAMRKKIKNQKGFTLIEMLVVISIIGVLAAIGVPKFMDTTATARTAKVQAELGAIDSAIQIYAANNAGTLPTQKSDVQDYMNGSAIPTVAAGKYKIGNNATLLDVNDGAYDIADGQAIVTLAGKTYTATELTNAIATSTPK